MSCSHCEGIREEFNADIASRELRRFRRRGAAKATRLLVEAVRERAPTSGSLLDIGGGIGAIHHVLLEGAVGSATHVDASPAYIAAAREEASLRGHGDQVHFVEGDFVELAPTLDAADVVTLDRVICCYPDMPALVARSAALARH